MKSSKSKKNSNAAQIHIFQLGTSDFFAGLTEAAAFRFAQETLGVYETDSNDFKKVSSHRLSRLILLDDYGLLGPIDCEYSFRDALKIMIELQFDFPCFFATLFDHDGKKKRFS